MSNHEQWLRQVAEVLQDEGRYGLGNTCEQAADHISFLEAEVTEQARLLGESGSTEARLNTRIRELEEREERYSKAKIADAHRIALLEALVIQIHDRLEHGDVFGWDDGDECWTQMIAVKEQWK
jgi:hypothetical protein